jgi:2'-5' RNA ligase
MTKMEQVIIINIKNKKEINKLRKKYDPNYKKYLPHLTLIYRFKKLPKEIIQEHIKNSIKRIKPFEVIFKGYSKSSIGLYLHLNIKKGESKLMKLHKSLKTGPLRTIKNPKMPRYVPHISLGYCYNKNQLKKIMKSLPKNLEVREKINSIYLLTIDKKRKIKTKKRFVLK